tara:strand:+ start:326 stop:976 length:651 start_codon:yes stop_codon:yes gene_type:complete
MAAVIGNNGIYNRNPNAVPRGYAGGDYIFLADDSNGAVTSRSQNFWDNGVWTASVTSAVAANTARTIVNISGKSGFLISGLGSNTGSGAATFVITVDGVATSLSYPAISPNTNQKVFFGAIEIGGGTTSYIQGAAAGSSGTDTWNSSDTAVNFNNNSFSNNGLDRKMHVRNPMEAISNANAGCIRFENSLTVTYSQAQELYSNIDNRAGVMYKLDA